MLNAQEAAQIIRTKVIDEVQPGDHAGGSGHLTNVSLDIENIDAVKTESGWEVDYKYTVSYASEFDYAKPEDERTKTSSEDDFPDMRNPQYHKKAILDKNGNIREEESIF